MFSTRALAARRAALSVLGDAGEHHPDPGEREDVKQNEHEGQALICRLTLNTA